MQSNQIISFFKPKKKSQKNVKPLQSRWMKKTMKNQQDYFKNRIKINVE